jgi:hypothetical protein
MNFIDKLIFKKLIKKFQEAVYFDKQESDNK